MRYLNLAAFAVLLTAAGVALALAHHGLVGDCFAGSGVALSIYASIRSYQITRKRKARHNGQQ